MKKAKQIEAEIVRILTIPNEEEVLSRMRGYIESLTDEDSNYAKQYAEEYLARRRAAIEEAFRESTH